MNSAVGTIFKALNECGGDPAVLVPIDDNPDIHRVMEDGAIIVDTEPLPDMFIWTNCTTS